MKEILKGNRFLVSYILFLLAIGIWQLLDWYFGSEDPIWHLFFYLVLIPGASFFFGLIGGEKKYPWIYPFVSMFLVDLLYVFMANGGPSFDSGAFQIGIPSFLSCLVAAAIRKIHARLSSST